ncbi:MAG: DNA methyltransferase [Myxococcota bacterium]
MISAVNTYLNAVENEITSGNTTEHSFRPALKTLIEVFGKDVTAINEPRRIKCGAPDYIMLQNQVPLGFIETKDLNDDLDKAEKTEQLKRYFESLPNLILTNYLEFRWYIFGEPKIQVKIGDMDSSGKIQKRILAERELADLLSNFFDAKIPAINTSKELAERMAGQARQIKYSIFHAITDEDKGGSLNEQMEGFKRVLLHDLSEQQFADMYAQTISYGLFAARCNTLASGKFTRMAASDLIPKTNPFLKKLFHYITGPELDDRVVWVVDNLAELLDSADIYSILQDFGKRTKQEDPIIHFYETFLFAYDSKMREARGVYYTPEPVVSFIVDAIDSVLKEDFNLSDGLANAEKIKIRSKKTNQEMETHKVFILDPAAGTGTFLYKVIARIRESFGGKQGLWSTYVQEHLLPRLFGFEILMAPYTVAHMKLGLLLAESGYDFSADERLRIYLTNTLEEAHEKSNLPLFASWVAEEANAASEIKKDLPIMVILGNPPYSAESQNKGEWITRLVKDSYYPRDGMKEQNPKLILDDYVKFIRFAQWRIENTGYGILGFISNHAYLDNVTFRGMRLDLMKTFDEIYILNLHGNVRKRELSPDGSKDANVFNIQQGVAVGIFVKRGGEGKKRAVVKYADLWGTRQNKYETLEKISLKSRIWTKLEPTAPFYLFIKQDTKLLREYSAGYKITEIMPLNSTGIKTHRDHFVFAFDKKTLEKRINDFRNLKLSDERIIEKYNIQDTRDWKLNERRKSLAKNKDYSEYFTKCLYRPFDLRHYYHHKDVIELPRGNVMRHMEKENLALITARQKSQESLLWSLAHVTSGLTESCAISNKGKEMNYIFPLYLYPVSEEAEGENNNGTIKGSEFNGWSPGKEGRKPNLSFKFVKELEEKLKLKFISDAQGDLKKTFGPEDIIRYIYAVLHSPLYRNRYEEYLRIDFPRIPTTSDKKLFKNLCVLGEKLINLHLLRNVKKLKFKYPVKRIADENVVEDIRYTAPGEDSKEGRIWLNKEQYLEGVSPEVWEFVIGGYQVCQKWLKERKNKQLSFDELETYQKIISAIHHTIRLMNEIDKAINSGGGLPLR